MLQRDNVATLFRIYPLPAFSSQAAPSIPPPSLEGDATRWIKSKKEIYEDDEPGFEE